MKNWHQRTLIMDLISSYNNFLMERINVGYSEIGERLKQAKGIIFSDVDGVWLDEQNNFAFPDSKNLEAIVQAQSQGFVIILNSDTGGESLLQLSKELGITSDLCIAENGSYIQRGPDVLMVQQPDARGLMSELRTQVAEILSASGTIWQGDATRAIRNESINNRNPLYLINTSRQCSVGIYARQSGMRVDQTLTDLVYQSMTEAGNGINDIEISQYPAIGSCLVRSANRPSKADAVSVLLSQTGFNGPCFMIGDTVADNMSSLSGTVTTYAVGNATDELKANADFIESTGTIDQSAAIIINSIINS